MGISQKKNRQSNEQAICKRINIIGYLVYKNFQAH